jgi:sulfite exporter TauE/SafE
MLADCLHDLAALGPVGLAGLLGALLAAGLASGLTHCGLMCAPFVLAQAAATAGHAAAGGRLRRLAGAALLPYQAGRMLGYGLLGALAGGLAGALGRLAGELRLLLAGLLLLAAVAMAAQASRRVMALLPRATAPAPPPLLARTLGPLLAAPTGLRGVALGLLLSALPCGVLYGALAAAAASGSAAGGALGMAAFVAGTIPALTGIALLGRLFGRERGRAMHTAGAVLFALNAVVLAGVALRLAAGA